MSIKVKNVISFLIITFVALLLMRLSQLMHQVIDSALYNILLSTLGNLIYLIVFFQILEEGFKVLNENLNLKIKSLYKKLLDNPREKVEHYLQINTGHIPCLVLGQLLVAFYEDEEIFRTLLIELKKQYELDNLTHPIVSYIFLENQKDGDIACFFDENEDFKNECERFSKSIVERFVHDLFDSSENGLSMNDFQEVLIGLIHTCLPQNHIPRKKMIYILRTILTWVCNEISEENIEKYQNTMALLLILLPVIQRKIYDMKIHNEYLDKKISEIQKSKWKDLIIKNMCVEIIDYYQKDSGAHINPNQCACSASVLSVYFENISFFNRSKLYLAIKRGNGKLFLKYDSFTDDEALSLLICSTVFGKINARDEFLERIASVMFLCATAPFSHLTKIGGQV